MIAVETDTFPGNGSGSQVSELDVGTVGIARSIYSNPGKVSLAATVKVSGSDDSIADG